MKRQIVITVDVEKIQKEFYSATSNSVRAKLGEAEMVRQAVHAAISRFHREYATWHNGQNSMLRMTVPAGKRVREQEAPPLPKAGSTIVLEGTVRGFQDNTAQTFKFKRQIFVVAEVLASTVKLTRHGYGVISGETGSYGNGPLFVPHAAFHKIYKMQKGRK